MLCSCKTLRSEKSSLQKKAGIQIFVSCEDLKVVRLHLQIFLTSILLVLGIAAGCYNPGDQPPWVQNRFEKTGSHTVAILHLCLTACLNSMERNLGMRSLNIYAVAFFSVTLLVSLLFSNQANAQVAQQFSGGAGHYVRSYYPYVIALPEDRQWIRNTPCLLYTSDAADE